MSNTLHAECRGGVKRAVTEMSGNFTLNICILSLLRTRKKCMQIDTIVDIRRKTVKQKVNS